MSFLRRRGAEVVPPIEVESAPESTEPVDPHAFIGEHEDELYKSAVNWGEIARNVRDFRSEYHDEIKAGLIDVWEANRQDPLPPDENLERETDRFGSTLSVYSFVAARYTSTIVYDPARSHAKAFKDVIGMTRDLFMHIPDHTYNYVLRSKRFPTHRFMMRQQALASAMFEADLHSNSILEGLVHAYEERPNDLRGLSELYADGAAENDRRYQELQSLIAADWYRPDPSQSILRGFCQYLREQPEAYLPDFSEQVVQSERSTRLQAIRQMAAFALIASGAETVTDTGIIETLHRTYSHWDQVADLQQLFSDFVNGKVGQTEQAFQAIAGPRNRKDMRMYPTAEEVEELRQNLVVPFLGQTDPVSRQHRRKASRVQQKAQKRNPFPEYSNLDDIAAVEQGDRQPARRLAVVKKGASAGGNNFITPQEIATEDIAQEFKLGNDQRLISDVRNMIDWIQNNPISVASKQISARLIVHNRQLKVMRLAPEDCTNIGIHPANRYYRIVYALTPDSILLLDILPHEEFDKRYNGSR